MARYSDGLVDEILSSTDIVSVINDYVPLTRRGANFLGLCPFHKEKTPSFTVSPDKQIYKCFGCGEGGNVISFISKLENLDFKDTLEVLAERANIDTERFKQKGMWESSAIKDEKETIFNINKATAKYFYEALVEQVETSGSLLKAYLDKRKLDKTTIVRFGLGFGNKKSIGLIKYLKGLGYTEQDILKAGVVTKNPRGELYENFAGRLIFPIFDVRDRVIGFGGRVLDKSLPKYVNSPENAVYYKGKNLYALNVAKRDPMPYVILTEGYMDTIALQKSGLTNVVASLGTALTEGQAKLLKKYTSTVIISYDQDNAGQTATLRAIGIFEAEGIKAKVLRLNHPDVKDPDEYINKYGVDAFRECVKNAISAVEYKILKAQEGKNLDDFDDKLEFLVKTADILSKIDNKIEQNMYIDLVSSKYNIAAQVLSEEISKREKKSAIIDAKKQQISRNIAVKKKIGTNNIRRKQEEFVIALMLSSDKKTSKSIIEKYSEEDFDEQDLKKLYKKVTEIAKEQDLSKVNIVSKFDNEEDIKLVTEILCIDLSLCDKTKLMQDLEDNFKKYRYMKKRAEIVERLTDKNVSDDEKRFLEAELSLILKKMGKIRQN